MWIPRSHRGLSHSSYIYPSLDFVKPKNIMCATFLGYFTGQCYRPGWCRFCPLCLGVSGLVSGIFRATDCFVYPLRFGFVRGLYAFLLGMLVCFRAVPGFWPCRCESFPWTVGYVIWSSCLSVFCVIEWGLVLLVLDSGSRSTSVHAVVLLTVACDSFFVRLRLSTGYSLQSFFPLLCVLCSGVNFPFGLFSSLGVSSYASLYGYFRAFGIGHIRI